MSLRQIHTAALAVAASAISGRPRSPDVSALRRMAVDGLAAADPLRVAIEVFSRDFLSLRVKSNPQRLFAAGKQLGRAVETSVRKGDRDDK